MLVHSVTIVRRCVSCRSCLTRFDVGLLMQFLSYYSYTCMYMIPIDAVSAVVRLTLLTCGLLHRPVCFLYHSILLLYLSEITLSIHHQFTIHSLVMDIYSLIFQPILHVFTLEFIIYIYDVNSLSLLLCLFVYCKVAFCQLL